MSSDTCFTLSCAAMPDESSGTRMVRRTHRLQPWLLPGTPTFASIGSPGFRVPSAHLSGTKFCIQEIKNAHSVRLSGPRPRLDGPMTVLPAFAPLPELAPGDRVAVLSPSFAAPGFAPAVHEQAVARIRDTLALVPVEYPTTRKLGATAAERAADINAAFADPGIGAIFATLGETTRSRSRRILTRGWWPRTPSRSSATATTPTC